MKRFMIVVMGVVAMLLANTAYAVTVHEAGADWLITQQFTATTDPTHPEYNGGWGWKTNYTYPGSATTGPVVQGMLRAYDLTGNTDYLDSAKRAGDYIMNVQKHSSGGEARLGTYDPYIMWELSQRAADSTWSNHVATNFYGALANSTYGPNNYDTAGYISYVQGVRTGDYVNVRSWEFATLAYTATKIGQTGQADLFEAAILDGLNTLDSAKGSELLGVAAAVRGLALKGTESFTAINSPLHSGINGIDTLGELADYLVGRQDSAGHWSGDTQTTATSVLALMALDPETYASSLQAGQSYLVGMQDASGFFRSFPGQVAPFTIQTTGEALAAIPEPGTVVLLITAGLGAMAYAWRRRRS